MTRPNLFDYAKKELSQDAMICWLICWADDQYADSDSELHACGREFVRALLRKHEVDEEPDRIETRVFQQDKGIDVLARVSPDHVLLIEDKTGSRDHGGQLRRYYEYVINGRTRLGNVNEQSVYPIYLKTGNQSRSKDSRIERATEGFYRGYRVLNRTVFLDVLRLYRGSHQALIDYRDYLERWEADTESFREWEANRRTEWSWSSWEGFYQFLEDTLRTGDWSYVANASGGFLGFWWNYITVNGNAGPQIYLQLEADLKNNRRMLCFKVWDAEQARRRHSKQRWHSQILEAGGGRVVRPRVMRVGGTTTVGHWGGDWLAFREGKINLPGTVENLRAAEQILRNAAEARQ